MNIFLATIACGCTSHSKSHSHSKSFNLDDSLSPSLSPLITVVFVSTVEAHVSMRRHPRDAKKGVHNWSLPLTRMILVCGLQRGKKS